MRLSTFATYSYLVLGAITPSAPARLDHPLLFRLTSPAGVTSHVLGTIHLGVGADELPASVRQIFARSAVHAYEMNVAQSWDHLKRVRREPELLDDLLRDAGRDPRAPGDFTSTEMDQLVSLGVPRHVARKMRDDQCSLFVGRHRFFGEVPLASLDLELQRETLSRGTRLVELDTDQLRDQAEAADRKTCRIREYLNDPAALEAIDRDFIALVAQYRTLTPALVLEGPFEEDPGTSLRNAAWAKTLVPVMSGAETFVVVGYSHLAGPRGLLRLLEIAGFRIEH